MFNLQSCVHFHEPEPVFAQTGTAIRYELDCTGPGITDRARRRNCCITHGCAHAIRHAWCGRFFNDLLMPPLHRAVTLKQMDDATGLVGKNLHFDMARRSDVFLDQYMPVTKAGCPFAHRTFQRRIEI